MSSWTVTRAQEGWDGGYHVVATGRYPGAWGGLTSQGELNTCRGPAAASQLPSFLPSPPNAPSGFLASAVGSVRAAHIK